MGAIQKYNEPTTVAELARLFEVFMVSEFRWGAGRAEVEGGEFLEYDLDGEAVAVLIMPAERAYELRRMARAREAAPASLN